MRGTIFALLLSVAALGAPASAIAAPTSFAAYEQSIEEAREAMMGDPKDALAASLKALDLAKALPVSKKADEAQATAQWLHAESLIYLNRIDEAQPIVDEAIGKIERVDPSSKLHGDLLRSRGAIMAAQGHVLDALRDYQKAYRVYRKAKVDHSQAIALQDIGLIYFEGDDYPRALSYFDQSGEVYSDDPVLTLTMHNNRAEVLRKQGNHEAASAEYRAALQNARKLESPMLVTRILTNLAMSQADEGKYDAARTSIREAQRLAAQGEAAGWRPFVDGVSAKLALQQGNIGQAVTMIERAFDGQDLEKTELLYREYHAAAAQIYERAGNEAEALAHFKAFQRLDSEARQTTASTASQLMGARFDFANLKQNQLESDIQLERQKGAFRNALLIASAIVLALLLFGFISIRRSRNRVRAANNELTVVNVELEDALKAKTEFLATTSHEIRTPLNGILGMTQVLLTDRTIKPDLRERIEVVHGAGKTMRALVDDILDVAKIESGRLTVLSEPVDLRGILQDAERLWRGEAETKNVTLSLDVADIPGSIVSDGGRLRQVVFNLMSNALKFTPAGTVALAAHITGGDAPQITLTLSDTGIGIPAGELEKIFEPFHQVEGGTTRQYGGTGLGLAICRKLVEALGGTLTAESIVGEGSVFTVRLPLVNAETEDANAANDECTQPSTAGRATLDGANLLLVDANLKNLSIMNILLAPHAESIDTAASTGDALTMMEGVTHLVVDSTAAANERDTLLALMRIAREAGAKLTLLHTPNETQSTADMMMLGAEQLVIKPIGAAELLTALQSLYTGEPETFVAPSILQRDAA